MLSSVSWSKNGRQVRHNVALIDDAATALGGRYKKRFLGGHGIPTCFSFHPRKIITTGEGGMLLTDDVAQAERARVLRSAGASVSDLDRHQAKGAIVQKYYEPGYNYRMTDLQAAIGLVQLQRLPAILEQRQEQAHRYDNALRRFDEIQPPMVPDYAQHAYSSYCIRLRPEAGVNAAQVVRCMAEHGISCRHGIQPLHLEPVFAKEALTGQGLAHTEAAVRETLFLPIFPGLTIEQQERVVSVLERACARS